MWCRVYVLVLLLLVTIARPTESSSLCANRKPSSGPATASGSPPDPPPGSMQMCSNLLAFGARGRVHDGFGFSPADGETECQLQTTGTFEPRPSQEISGLKKTKEEQAIAIANLSAALEEALRGKQIAEENARREKAEKEREKQEKEREKEEKEREKQEKEREKKEKEQALLRNGTPLPPHDHDQGLCKLKA
eukprot:tig00020704_g13204.t1